MSSIIMNTSSLSDLLIGPLMIDIAATSLEPEDRDILLHPLVGGIIFFTRNYADRKQLRELVTEIRSLRATDVSLSPLLIAVDQEGGKVQRFRNEFSELPPLRWLGHLYDQNPSLAREIAMCAARVMAIEILDTGIDFSFAPVVDIDWGKSDVIGHRALHRRSSAVTDLGLAYVQGMRQVGMAAVAKHFPGHGGVTADSHHTLPVDTRTYAELLEDIDPYSSLINKGGLHGIMMAHIRYPNIEPQIASLSAFWMQHIVRETLAFHGAIFSDDMSMAGASEGGSVAKRVTTSLNNGADMALICNDRSAVISTLAAMESGIEAYVKPTSNARLAAMGAVRAQYDSTPYLSDKWQRDVERLLQLWRAQPLL
jgi:beta-N-acetylhexosaminidase